jgi:hypothetical protein
MRSALVLDATAAALGRLAAVVAGDDWPAGGASHGEAPRGLLAQVLGDVRGARGTGQTFAREPDLFRGIADFLALARHHEVDGAADLGGDALGRQRHGRRWGIERRRARLASGFSMIATICA